MKKIVIISILFCLIYTHAVFAEKVKLVTLEWEPYIGKSLKNKGYVHEIVAEAFKRAGIAVEIQFYPWARAVNLAKKGKSDGLFPEYYDETRLNDFVFSDSFTGGPVGLYKRKDENIFYSVDPRFDQTAALESLKKYYFGVVRGYINTKAFDEASFLKKDMANCDETNLKKLFGGRIDLIFIDQYVAKHIIANKHPHFKDKLEFMEPALEIKPLYIAFSKKAIGYEKKLKAFNAALKEMKEENMLAAIMAKHGFLMENYVKTLVEK